MHPLWLKYNIGAVANRRPVVNESSLSEMRERIAISPSGTILRGFQAYGLAKQRGQFVVECIEYPIAERDALLWILENSSRHAEFNDFLKIVLVLEATTDLLDRARQNQSLGGKHKLLTNLSEAQSVTYRKEVARIANVSERNVDKVRQILAHAKPELTAALGARQVSIHRAWRWIQNPERQLEFLRFHLAQANIAATVDRRQRPLGPSSKPTSEHYDLARLGMALGVAAKESKNEVLIGTAPGPGKFILLSKELFRSLENQGELIL